MAIRLRDRPVIQRECAGPGRCRCATCGDDRERGPDAAQLLALQRQAGNAAVADLVRPVAVQRGMLGDLVDGASALVGGGADAVMENVTATVDGVEWLVGTRPAATAALPGVESLPPGVGSGTGPKAPGQVLGDTPGSRTPDLTPGVKESQGGAPITPIGMAICLASQVGRVGAVPPGAGFEIPTVEGLTAKAKFLAEKLGLCAVAKCLPSRVVVKIIEDIHFAGQPQAVANLNHYIEGSGSAFPQPMSRLMSDRGVRSKLATLVAAQGPAPGQRIELDAPLNQNDYTQPEWLNALGNVDFMAVTVLDDPGSRATRAANPAQTPVQVELRDPYQWHPRDARVTQCLHELFEAMKADGAAEYDAVGTGNVTLDLGEFVPATPKSGEGG